MKIALCIPCYGDPKGKFVQSILDMVVFTKDAKLTDGKGEPLDVEIATFIVSSSILTESRHRLVAEAVLWEADYMLWMDADHTFPKDALCRLWARNVPVVGVNYARRCFPTAPTAAKIITDDAEQDHKNLVYTTVEKAEANELEEVSHLGFGLCLVNMRVYDGLQVHAESQGLDSFLPLFQFVTSPSGAGVIGEDVYYFNKVRDAGFAVYCDHGLSWEIGHIGDQLFTNAHAETQRERWIEKQRETSRKFAEKADELDC